MTASVHDRNLIIPIVLVVILAILMLLLRAVVAHLLILTTILSFGDGDGRGSCDLQSHPAVPEPTQPCRCTPSSSVALGIDYNIFLMTRVREESKRHGTREESFAGSL